MGASGWTVDGEQDFGQQGEAAYSLSSAATSLLLHLTTLITDCSSSAAFMPTPCLPPRALPSSPPPAFNPGPRPAPCPLSPPSRF